MSFDMGFFSFFIPILAGLNHFLRGLCIEYIPNKFSIIKTRMAIHSGFFIGFR